MANIAQKYDALKQSVQEWLDMDDASFHASNIVLGALLNGTNAVTNIHTHGSIAGATLDWLVAGIGSLGTTVTDILSQGLSGIGGMEQVFTEANALLDELKNPNIDGIPIHATAEQEVQDVQVARNMLIDQDAGNKSSYISNATPQLRTWNIQGYLVASGYLSPLDSNLVIKPSLMTQREILQYYADSRKPVWYKTHDNRFFRVLITHFDSQYTAQSLNSITVNLQLTEYKVLEIKSSNLPLEIAKKVAEVSE